MSKRPKPSFNVGDIVRVKTGDGRWHRIVKVEWDEGLREGFCVYHFHDGGASVAGYDLAPIEKRVLHLVLTHHWAAELNLQQAVCTEQAGTEG